MAVFGFFVQAKVEMKVADYNLGDSHLEIEKNSNSEIIDLAKKENDKETAAGQVKIVDQYLLSDLPENEFLGKYPQLKSGFEDLKIEIEADQPLFKKENFYHAKSFFDKIKSSFLGEKISDYRLIREIKNNGEKLETSFNVSSLSFKTVYEEKEGKIKQGLSLENSSDQEINFQLTLTHSLAAEQVSFNQQEYGFFETPLMLPAKEGNSISFFSNIPGTGNLTFTYDFSDLMNLNPEIWLFRKDSKANLLVKTFFSIAPHSSTIIDPSYVVDVASSSTATAYSFQRKTWHDGTRFWVGFHSDLDNRMEFWYSTDGTSWTENTSARISMDTYDFSVDCDSSNCFIVYPSSSAYLIARKDSDLSVYPSTNWAWSAATTVTYIAGYVKTKPFVSRSSGGYLWVSFFHEGSRGNKNFSYISSLSPNNINNWNTVSTLDTTVAYYHGVIVRSTGTRMLAVWAEDLKILSKKYNGSSWDSTATTVGYLYSSDTAGGISAVYDTIGDVHLIFRATGSASNVAYKRYISASDAWATTVYVASTTAPFNAYQYNTVSVDDSSRVYAMYINTPAAGLGYLYYLRGSSPYYNSSNWEDQVTLASGTNGNYYWLTSNFFPYTGFGSTTNNISALWTKASGTNYEIRSAIIDTSGGNSAPTVGTTTLNGGNNITLIESSSTTVSATATITDTNGYSDIASVTGKIYHQSAGASCSDDDNDCYSIASCATSSCSVNSCTATCQANLWFHANPTDVAFLGPTYSWLAWIKVTDRSNASSTGTSGGVDVNTLHALDVSSLYERYNTGDDTYGAYYGALWAAQTFTIGNTGFDSTHNVNIVRIKASLSGTPGTTTLSIKATDASGAPTGTDLVSVSGNADIIFSSAASWATFPLSAYSLATGTKYAIVVRLPYGSLGNGITIGFDNSASSYSGGQKCGSSDSGVTWTCGTTDFVFEEYGTGGINYGTLSPGGNTGSSHEQNIILNTGNSTIDSYLYGTDLEKQ